MPPEAQPHSDLRKPCRCHSSELYLSLVECPACGHWSLDRLPGWEGCERRACGYQKCDTGIDTDAA
jgi:hypothetical protein